MSSYSGPHRPCKAEQPAASSDVKRWCIIHGTDAHSLADCPGATVTVAERDFPDKLHNWSITFDESDCPCPDNAADLSPSPIMVEPVIYNYKVSRVFMDGGSSLNILTAKTLDAMQVPRSAIKPVYRPFKGVVPGSVTAIGQVTLPVTFGTSDNFRTETLLFDLVDFEMPHKANAILGLPAFAKFMAIPHYVYQCMKMPGPNGVITVDSHGNVGP